MYLYQVDVMITALGSLFHITLSHFEGDAGGIGVFVLVDTVNFTLALVLTADVHIW